MMGKMNLYNFVCDLGDIDQVVQMSQMHVDNSGIGLNDVKPG